MLQPRREPDLPLESLGTERGGQLGVEHLERHRPVVLEIPSEIHRRHAAAAELALDHVAVCQCLAQLTPRSAIQAVHRHQLLEPGVLPQRIVGGIDLEPAGREIERDLEQRLEQVQRLLLLAQEHVRPHRLQLDVRTSVGVLRDRRQRHARARASRSPRSSGRGARASTPRMAWPCELLGARFRSSSKAMRAESA